MKAIMLAAGMGNRLSGGDPAARPKSLLSFGGKTLLERHIENLRALGVAGLSLVIGYQADKIETELDRLEAGDFVETILNTEYQRGSLLSLAHARSALVAGEDILFMDADVLYTPRLLARLCASGQPNCFLFDGDFEPGEEPVKICLQGGVIVAFGKRIGEAHEVAGEWPGFLRLSAPMGQALATIIAGYLEQGEKDRAYEDALGDLILDRGADNFAIEDISGEPWIEIDFPEDVRRAEQEILPRIERLERDETS